MGASESGKASGPEESETSKDVEGLELTGEVGGEVDTLSVTARVKKGGDDGFGVETEEAMTIIIIGVVGAGVEVVV